MAAVFAEEAQEQRAEHVERGHERGEHADPVHPRRVLIRSGENRILTMESGKGRHARDRHARAQQRPAGDRNFAAQPAHLAQILLAAQRVNHAAGAQEQQRLEERVRHHVEDSGGKRSRAEAKEHVAQLRNRRVGEDFLDIVLRQTDGGGEERRCHADDRDDVERECRVQENRRAARDHVHASGDHGRGVDQRANRRRTGHGVGQPDVERNLRRFSGRAEQQQQADRRDPSRRRFHRHVFRLRENFAEIERAEVNRDQEDCKRESEIADTVHDERFVAGVGGEFFEEIESDQQIAAQSDAFPSDEEQQEVRAQHQNQHEEHEQVQIREEAVVSAFVSHVADGVDMNQKADAGDDHQHDGGQPVNREIDTDVQSAGLDPGEVMLGICVLKRSRKRAEPTQRFQDPQERQQHRPGGDRADHGLRQLAAK